MSFKLPIFLFLLFAVPVLAEFSDGDSDVLYQINQHVTQMRNVQSISNSRLDSILSRLSYIQDYVQSISENTYLMNSDIHSISTDIHSISSFVDSISFTLPSITNIFTTDQGESITDILVDIRQSITNSVPLCYDFSSLTNAFISFGLIPKANMTEQQILDLVRANGFYDVLNLNPYYWASTGFIAPYKYSAHSSATSTVGHDMMDKVYSGLTSLQIRNLNYGLDTVQDVLDFYDNAYGGNASQNYITYLRRSEFVKEKLYGTYDIEEILKSFTNQVSSSILNSYYQSSFNDQLSYATNLLRGSSSDFSTSVSSPTNATIFSTEDSSWSSAMSSSEFTPDDTQFVASFQDGFNQFVSTWQEGIQVGSPTLVVHFAGVDGQLENTFSLDYTISNEARNKVRSIWRVIFTLIRASLYFWGYMSLLRAVLNNYADTMRHNDFLEGADID